MADVRAPQAIHHPPSHDCHPGAGMMPEEKKGRREEEMKGSRKEGKKERRKEKKQPDLQPVTRICLDRAWIECRSDVGLATYDDYHDDNCHGDCHITTTVTAAATIMTAVMATMMTT